MIMRGYRQQMDISALRTFDNDLFIKVEIVTVEMIVEFVEIAEMGLVGIGVAEGKVNPFLFTFK